MFNVGDKVKWNGRIVGEMSIPVELTDDMIGIVSDVYPKNDYPYEVKFEFGYDTFYEEELVLA